MFLACVVGLSGLVAVLLAHSDGSRVDRLRLAVILALVTIVGAAKLFAAMPDWAFVSCVLLLIAAGRFWPARRRR